MSVASATSDYVKVDQSGTLDAGRQWHHGHLIGGGGSEPQPKRHSEQRDTKEIVRAAGPVTGPDQVTIGARRFPYSSRVRSRRM